MAFVDIGLDLQIFICTYLRPADILTLRKTCKSLQLVTRQRIIWVEALRRVCSENTLFLPSFPISDMSDVELEQAAIAPRRWIELSNSLTVRELSDPEARLSPTTTRIIDGPFANNQPTSLILVPGGRYMVAYSPTGFGVWDLGYTSSADCRLIASVEPEGGSFTGKVHATPDGMGLVIYSLRPLEHCSFYEIYPQSETPQLTKIASLHFHIRYRFSAHVSAEKMLWYNPHLQETIFRVWDYRLNASVSFKALPDTQEFFDNLDSEVIVTQTALVMLRESDEDSEILIWAMPSLSPQLPDFDDYDLAYFPPAIRVKFPGGLASDLDLSFTTWRIMSSWYFDPSKPLYFDKVSSPDSDSQIDPRDLQIERFKIIIKPDFSDATLHFIITVGQSTSDFDPDTPFQPMFCEDTPLYSWSASNRFGTCTGSTLLTCTGLTSFLSTLHHPSTGVIRMSLPTDRSPGIGICPASGRIVSGRDTNKIVVFDFLPHQRLFI